MHRQRREPDGAVIRWRNLDACRRQLCSGVGGTDETQNFAIWYSFYRTRILLIKSAASLAFTPLTDSFRVGFITVKPKDNPTDAAINPNKYLAIDDFNTTQRGLWFNKVFSQVPGGSSPTREGLARVGRMYAGKHDGINTGMNDDPAQYWCQQNFTIMTTDGYWNAQDESTPQGSFIGVWCKWDGKSSWASKTARSMRRRPTTPRRRQRPTSTAPPVQSGTAPTTAPAQSRPRPSMATCYVPCGTYFNMTTTQANASTSQLLKTTTQSTQSTTQSLQSTQQNLQSTTQMQRRRD